MGQKTRYIALVVILLAAFVLSGVAYRVLSDRYPPEGENGSTMENNTAAQSDAEPVYAPDFTVEDAEGNDVRLTDFLGKPILVNFWASWCGPCKSELPAFDAAYQKYGDDIQFMMVDLTDGYQETLVKAKSFVKENHYTFPVFFDTGGSAVSAYGLYSIPVTVAINAEGEIVSSMTGAMSEGRLALMIDALLS